MESEISSLEMRIETSEGECTVISLKLAQQCGTLRTLLDTFGVDADVAIPIPKVSKNDLALILTFLERFPPGSASTEVETRHTEDAKYDGVVSLFYGFKLYGNAHVHHVAFESKHVRPLERRFFDSIPSRSALFSLLNAANYLDVPALVDVGSAYIAEKIKDLSVDEAREYLNLPDDLKGWEGEQAKADAHWIPTKEPKIAESSIRDK